MLVWWKTFTATQMGMAEKIVTCEKCGNQFAYSIMCTAEAQATSLYSIGEENAANRAAANADSKVRSALESEIQARSCPACGHFQSHMIEKARETVLPWMGLRTAGVALLIYFVLAPLAWCLNGTIVLVGSVIPWSTLYYVLGGILAVIIMMSVVRWICSRFYDPNVDTPERRIRRGLYPGRPYIRYNVAIPEVEALLRGLSQRASKLQNKPHPLGNSEEMLRLTNHIDRYTSRGSWDILQKDMLRLAGQIARGNEWDYREAGDNKVADYYRECAEVYEAIYIEIFRELPRPISEAAIASGNPAT